MTHKRKTYIFDLYIRKWSGHRIFTVQREGKFEKNGRYEPILSHDRRENANLI